MNLRVVEANLELARRASSGCESLREGLRGARQGRRRRARREGRRGAGRPDPGDGPVSRDADVLRGHPRADRRGDRVGRDPAGGDGLRVVLERADLRDDRGPDRLEIYAYVDETDIGKIRPGLEVQFAVDSFPEKVFDGTVSAIYPKATIQDNVVYYVTVVSIENPAGRRAASRC